MDLIEMAESLPIDEKAMLVDRLLDSMYPRQKEVDELWKIEAERRVEEVAAWISASHVEKAPKKKAPPMP
jgi:putative addiction module component (TIGR02574 family)